MTLRERLSTRKRPTAVYRIRIDDSADAERELTEARAVLQFATLTGDEDRAARARARVEAAEVAFNACYEAIVLTSLKPGDFEALVDVHKARPGTGDEAWNVDTFPRACFMECAPAEMTEAEWDAFLADACSDAERTALYNTAIAVNVRVPDPTVPKDLMGILG